MHRLTVTICALLFVPFIASAQKVTLSADTDGDLVGELESASLLVGLESEPRTAPQDFVAAARADYKRILTALYASGYFGASVSITIDGSEAASIAPLDAPAAIDEIRIAVTTGDRFKFGTAIVAPITSATELPASFAKGKSARTGVINEAVNSAVDGWLQDGHAKAEVADQKISAIHASNTLDVRVAIAPGPRLRFGAVTVVGNSGVHPSRIIKIAGLPIGEVYDPDEVTTALRRLRRTGAFDSVSATPDEDIGPDSTLPYTITVKESKPRRFGLGIELSSIEGVRVSSYWLHRNFGIGAQRLRIDGEVSGIGGQTGGIDYRIGASFDRPAIYGADTDLFIRLEALRQDEPDYLLDKISAEIGASRSIGEDLQGELGIGVLSAREKNETFSRNYTLLTVPFTATLEKRDNVSNPKSGYFAKASTTPFVSVDGGTFGARVYGDARYYKSVGAEQKLTFAARGQLGSVFGAEIADAPADFLFYSGGGGTVRGQSYNALGAETIINGSLTSTGGLSYLGGQVEARYQVTDSIGVVGFFDYGQVTDGSGLSGNSGSHSGTGLGVRYNTGIGPIRLDIGTPASGDDAFESLQVYIGIGQAF